MSFMTPDAQTLKAPAGHATQALAGKSCSRNHRTRSATRTPNNLAAFVFGPAEPRDQLPEPQDKINAHGVNQQSSIDNSAV
jgi:hypothetical protein